MGKLFTQVMKFKPPVIFGKMHFLLISENEFTHEIKHDGITSFVDFMKTFLVKFDHLSQMS